MSAPPAQPANVMMVSDHRVPIPHAPLPPGYSLRGICGEQDVRRWAEIWRAAEPSLEIDDGFFARQFGYDAAEIARRCFLVDGPGGEAVATTSAWFDTDFRGHHVGRIHWVAVRPDAQGRGLARAMLAEAMRLLVREHPSSYLVTQPHRTRAIGIYLDFGFVPDLPDAAALAVWKSIAAAMAGTRQGALLARFLAAETTG